MNVAIATCAALPAGDEDTPALIGELAALGHHAEAVRWDGPADWAAYDLVMVRSTWDYHDRRGEFLEWARSVPRLENPAEVLTWNTDKRYLRDLEAAGVPVVPTLWDPAGLPEWPDYVIKPAVSAGARDTARWSADEAGPAAEHLSRLRSEGRTVMVQPYLDAVDSAGETALIFFDGVFSHAVRKAPILKAGAGIQPAIADTKDEREQIAARAASPAELALGGRVLQTVPGRPLYARVDLIPGPDGAPVLLELELTEPSLFLGHAPGAAARLAAALARRLTCGAELAR
ncbi:hypothetical protein LO762_16695 [Actinocorallia sp. API 0066]|uniref:ATP-grasp domain-containing protein n=1 Tax=Actinocorallia sp. API 0066 TaxID=2896846 RepID=UPI001E46CB5E|nr:hypothetical protein [Actinocorallia sp. API 0066]MCD0450818.1 hypothetical protein [Actinocorallia sp. API 0066]